MALGALLFGAMAVTTRAATRELPAAQIACLRFVIGLVGVGLVGLWRPALLRPSQFGALALRGLFGGIAVLTYFTAIERVGVGMGTLLNYMFPLWAALFGALWLGEPVGRRGVAGMLVASAGLAVVVGPTTLAAVWSGVADPAVRLGLGAGLVSSVLGGAATVTIRRLRRTETALTIFGAFCLGGLLVTLPGALTSWRPMSAKAAAEVLAVGLLSFGAQMLFTDALKFVTAGAGSLSTQLTVVSSYVLAWVCLGEPVPARVMAGGAVVLIGVLIVSRSAQPPVRDSNDTQASP